MAQDLGRPIAPPADLNTRGLRLARVSPRNWCRLFLGANGPCYYSASTGSRFSGPRCPVLYLGDKMVTVFWETFWDDLGPLSEKDRLLSKTKLAARDVIRVTARREFRVFDATNARALKAVSATPGTFTGDYAHCQAWALALLHHSEAPEGILYPSARHKGGVCLALFGARTDCADLDFFDRESAQASLPIRSLLAREKIGLLR